MRLATWNVNSVRARLPRLLEWLGETRPDVVCLQETKCLDEQFPAGPIEELGYQVALHGQRTYNGVALLARGALESVERGLGDERFDGEARVISATVGDLMIVSAYAINGQRVGHPRYHAKLAWFSALREHLARRFPMDEKVIVAGDLNCTFDDLDVHDPQLWREQILCSTPERTALREVLALGFADALREFHPDGHVYTWWDYYTRAFERGDRGLRIDYLLMSPAARAVCTGVDVDRAARGGDRPSDHAPVVATM
jgi:exodeoxyribonuclease III